MAKEISQKAKKWIDNGTEWIPLDNPNVSQTGSFATDRVVAINAQIGASPLASQGISQAPSAITSEDLSNTETPINIPETKPQTAAARIMGGTEALLEQNALSQKAEQDRIAKENELRAKEVSMQEQIERIAGIKSDVTATVSKETNLPFWTEEAKSLNEKLLTSQRQYIAEQKALENANMTDVGRAASRQSLDRKYGLEQSDLKFNLYLAQDRVSDAKAEIADKIALETEPLYAQLDLTKNVYNQISQRLSKSEDREWNLAIDELNQKIKNTENLTKYKGDIAITASQNGTPLNSYVQMKLNRAQNIEEVNQVLAEEGISLAKPGQKTGVSGVVGADGLTYESDLDAIIGATLSTIPTKFGQQTFNDQMIRARDDADKINLVAAQVLKGQPAEFKNDFRNQAVGISMIDKAIAELDKGTQTGAIQAGKQYAANFLGKDYDPALAKIEGYITSAIQPYRNSVTGAAWGDQEDAEYQSLFGSIKYSPAELRQRLLQTKELLKSKSAEGLNSFVNPLGTYENQFETGNLTPGAQNQNPEDIFDEVVGGKSSSSSWIVNAWNSLFN